MHSQEVGGRGQLIGGGQEGLEQSYLFVFPSNNDGENGTKIKAPFWPYLRTIVLRPSFFFLLPLTRLSSIVPLKGDGRREGQRKLENARSISDSRPSLWFTGSKTFLIGLRFFIFYFVLGVLSRAVKSGRLYPSHSKKTGIRNIKVLVNFDYGSL